MTAPERIWLDAPFRELFLPGEEQHGIEGLTEYVRADLHNITPRRDIWLEMVLECREYLKPGETPRQRMDRDNADVIGLMKLLAKEKFRVRDLRRALTNLIDEATPAVGHLTGYGETSTVRVNLRDAVERARALLDQTKGESE